MSQSSIDSPPLQEEDEAFDQFSSDGLRPLAKLRTASQRGRLSHALLFSGPAGTGKLHCAVRLAQLLSCEAEASPCLACPACERVRRGIDTNLMILQPGLDKKTGRRRSEITVEQVRELQQRLTFRASGGRRFVIIEPAEELSLVAQEAVLKTLEEPPEGVTLALLTSRPAALKPTVLSRCHVVRFPPLAASSLRDFLVGRGLSSDSARFAAALSGGNLRRALSLDVDDASESWVELARRLYEVLGRQGEGRARDVAMELAPGKGGGAAGLAELDGRLDLLQRILRDAMIGGEAGRDGESEELAERITHPGGVKAVLALATRLDPVAAGEAIDVVAVARKDLAKRCHAKVVLTSMFLELHALGNAASARRT